MNMNYRASLFFTIISLQGCAAFSSGDIANPSELTIDKALSSIGTGLNQMQKNLEGHKMGLWPCKLLVNLNVTASASEKGGLVLDTTIKPPSPAGAVTADIKAHADQTNESSAKRDNTISIEMYNAACLPAGTLAYDKLGNQDSVKKTLEDSLKTAPLNLKLDTNTNNSFKKKFSPNK